MKIRKKETILSTPWFDLVAKKLSKQKSRDPYYSIKTLDYVSVLALTDDNKVVCVRQYRPAVEKIVTELPSGHVEKDERPEESARRELLEETGYTARSMKPLGSFWSDTGRMSNRVWYFFAEHPVRRKGYRTQDRAIKTTLLGLKEFINAVKESRFEHSINLPVFLLAFLKIEKFQRTFLRISENL